MAGRKKTFPCGHTGRGQYCHRCAEEEARKQQSAWAKTDWTRQLAESPVPLQHLPKDIARKALRVIGDLQNGKTYLHFNGKRMITMGQRRVISVPVGLRYRLICIDQDGALQYIEVLTHEDYNTRLASGGWIP